MNTTDNIFTWTDELVKEFHELWATGMSENEVKKNLFPKAIEQFKASKQQPKEWEIQCIQIHNLNFWVDKTGKFHNQPFERPTSPESLLGQGGIIHSVKRLSDNEVFTVGGNTQYGIIHSLYICDEPDYYAHGKMMASFIDRANRELSELQKINRPLFETEDGVPLYNHTDKLYSVCTKSQWETRDNLTAQHMMPRPFYPKRYEKSWKHFSTAEKRDEYVLMNQPMLSLEDCLWIWSNQYADKTFNKDHFRKSFVFDAFKKFVQNKVNGSFISTMFNTKKNDK